MIENETKSRALLDELLTNAQLYKSSKNYSELLHFVARLPRVAPFNAMILHIQKPSIRYVASEHEWRTQFGRPLKPDARPLVILWPSAPVVFVHDVTDTVGDPLPDHFFDDLFTAKGELENDHLIKFHSILEKKHIHIEYMNTMEKHAGSIGFSHVEHIKVKGKEKEIIHYRLRCNQNQSPAVQFCTLIHELGHLFLGHLGGE